MVPYIGMLNSATVLTGRIRIKRIIMGFVEDGIGQFATC
jgi:hypothetical protein